MPAFLPPPAVPNPHFPIAGSGRSQSPIPNSPIAYLASSPMPSDGWFRAAFARRLSSTRITPSVSK